MSKKPWTVVPKSCAKAPNRVTRLKSEAELNRDRPEGESPLATVERQRWRFHKRYMATIPGTPEAVAAAAAYRADEMSRRG